MNETILQEEQVQAAIEHMNHDHQKNLVAYARVLADSSWAQSALITALDANGFDLLVDDGNGRQETQRIEFLQPVEDVGQLRFAFIQLAEQADPPDGIQRVATARVETPKAARYLKALCNHFNRKADGNYDDNYGRVQFPFGDCEFRAEEDALLIHVVAESETMFIRVKHVVADHVERFAASEELHVNWVDEETS